MEAFKILIKNISLLIFVGAVPSFFWAKGVFNPFSWPSLLLLLSGIFCLLWLKTYYTAYLLRKVLLAQDEEWALLEGGKIIDRSSYFPGESLEAFKEFLDEEAIEGVTESLKKLSEEHTPFQARVKLCGAHTSYTLRGVSVDKKIFLFLRNISEREQQEKVHVEKIKKNQEMLAKLQDTLDLLPILMWHRDTQQKLTYCNSLYAKAVQSSPDKICEEGIELIPYRSAKMVARKAFNTADTQMLESAAIANGERRNFRIYEMPDPYGGGTTGIAYDITEINALKTEMKKLIDAHRTVLDHLSTAVAVYSEDAALQYYNQAYVALHSFDEEFLRNRPHLDEVLEELRNKRQLPEYADFPAYKKRHLLQLKEQVSPQEDLMHLPDERTLRIFSAPHPLGGLFFMFEDVTDYLALERSNKALLDGYQATLDNLFEGILVLGSDSRLKISNPSFMRLWRFEEGEIQNGQHITDILEKTRSFFDYTDEKWETSKLKILENLTERIPKTGQLLRKDGTVVNFGYVPLPDGDHLFSYTDATNTSLVQQALQEKNEALETADRLKSDFISNVSHELRSPLTTIVGFIEILSRQYFGTLNTRQEEYVKGIGESSRHLLDLVNNILDLASIEAGHFKLQPASVDVSTFLKKVASLVEKRAESNEQHFIQSFSKGIKTWNIDERRVKQALYNLLNNAIKFTPPGGKIILEAKATQKNLEISVSDTGIGISSEEKSQVLKKFERGEGSAQRGAGVGLSLVKNIVELHGGYVQLDSEVHKGTRITCVFPKLVLENPNEKEQIPLKEVVGKS